MYGVGGRHTHAHVVVVTVASVLPSLILIQNRSFCGSARNLNASWALLLLLLLHSTLQDGICRREKNDMCISLLPND